jgi:hypothetical protein
MLMAQPNASGRSAEEPEAELQGFSKQQLSKDQRAMLKDRVRKVQGYQKADCKLGKRATRRDAATMSFHDPAGRKGTRTLAQDRRWPPASPPAARCATPGAPCAASYTTRKDTALMGLEFPSP